MKKASKKVAKKVVKKNLEKSKAAKAYWSKLSEAKRSKIGKKAWKTRKANAK
jgi:hypothetical protein